MGGHENLLGLARRARDGFDPEQPDHVGHVDKAACGAVVNAGGGHNQSGYLAIVEDEGVAADDLRAVPGFDGRHDLEALPEFYFACEHRLHAAQHRRPAFRTGHPDQAGAEEKIDAADVRQHEVAGIVEMAVEIDVGRQAAERQPALAARHIGAAAFGRRGHSYKAKPDIHMLFRIPSGVCAAPHLPAGSLSP